VLGDGDVNGGDLGRAPASAESEPASAAAARARFAGLELTLDGDPALCGSWLRAAGGGASAEPGDDPRIFLRCHLQTLPRVGSDQQLTAPGPRGLEWEWSEPRGRVRAPLGMAQVERERGGFRADVRVAREAPAARVLLVGLVSLLLNLRGGLVLHAASVALDGGAFAFIGPSGAGKSTACGLVRAAEPFAVDRLVLLPAPAGCASPWLAHPLPGGTPRPRELGSAARWLPLRGLLRVQPSSDGSRLEACSLPRAVLLARESTFQLGRGAEAERAHLATLERLVRDVGVARLHVRLGSDLTELLRASRTRLAQREIT
jgi:hypothetical protein